MLTKRSFTIQGHRTSVALEPEFWAAFDAAVARRATTPTALITAIDEARTRPLASAIRVFLLAEAQTPSSFAAATSSTTASA
ncbi:MAG: ribbon-helix-helix domain-containing protein [Sphingomonadaceae bacterium]